MSFRHKIPFTSEQAGAVAIRFCDERDFDEKVLTDVRDLLVANMEFPSREQWSPYAFAIMTAISRWHTEQAVEILFVQVFQYRGLPKSAMNKLAEEFKRAVLPQVLQRIDELTTAMVAEILTPERIQKEVELGKALYQQMVDVMAAAFNGDKPETTEEPAV